MSFGIPTSHRRCFDLQSAGIPNTSVAASLLEDMDQQTDRTQYEYIIQNVVGTAFVGTSSAALYRLCYTQPDSRWRLQEHKTL